MDDKEKEKKERTSFEWLMELLQPKKEYAPVLGRCERLWCSFSLDKQREIYRRIAKKKKERKFVDYNPLWAIQKNACAPPPQKLFLSFGEYYAKYHTTEERDGWHMVKPVNGNCYYEKSN